MGHVLILFGEMGSGKSFRAQRLSERANARGAEVVYIEGDAYMPNDMYDAVKAFGKVTEGMRHELTNNLIEAIHANLKGKAWGAQVVVSQALYFEVDRRWMQLRLSELGHVVEWRWVRVGWVRNMRQLLKRKNGLKWVAYWLLSKPFFQAPRDPWTWEC